MGPCAGGAVYSPALMDFVFMVKGVSHAFITGPRVVKATMGQDVDEDELGGAVIAQRKAGLACRSENNEAECFGNVKDLLSYLPQCNRQKPSRSITTDKPGRVDDALSMLFRRIRRRRMTCTKSSKRYLT